MARVKIDYGIDLGTTNSAICRMEKGEPVIIKTDVLKDTMPSCISINKKGSIKAGDSAYNTMKLDKRRATKTWHTETSNTYIEFKRTMGTNTRYHCSNLNKDFTSEELSSEVLKSLKSFVTDETITSVVITVPAKFTVNQKTATMEAAKMAGFKRCELLQEPIAASMAYGLNADEKDGLWMVFDFGGGTFDAALLKVEDGIMQVFDTEGDNYLGGKNLDYAIVDSIIIPYLMENYNISSTITDADKKEVLRDAMKTYAEEAKNQLSFKDHEDIISNLGDLGEDEDGEEIELDLTITQAEAFDVMRPYFQKAVDICKNLLQRNHLSGSQINKLILVGGPTHSPLIRQMLKEQITPNVDTSIDPMTAVATGAALYASTLDAEINDDEIQIGTVKLELGYESTSVETSEWVSVKLSDGTSLSKVWVEFIRADKAWSSGKTEVDSTGNVIEANLLEGKPNSFSIVAYDDKGNAVPCFPSEITIIQGSKVGSAPLPYNIGIAIWDENKKRGVFKMAKGLEKNKPLPAVGVINDLKTSKQLRPGIDADILTIPIYQTDDFAEAEGKTAALYEYVADVTITGDDVDSLIPTDSPVDVTLKVDSSEQMKVEVHFLATDISVEKALDTTKKQSIEDADKEISKRLLDAQTSISRLEEADLPTTDLRTEIEKVKEEYANSSEKKMVLQHLKEVLRKIENLDSDTEWQRLEKELREEFDRLEKAQQNLGNNNTMQLVEQLSVQTDKVIREKNIKLGRDTLEEINSLFVHLTMIYQCIGLIRECHERFGSIRWSDAARALQLINWGMEKINTQPTVDNLHPIACSLIELMPENEAINTEGLLR
ncbi:Heat shock protein 70 [Phocaeicola salanitronis DSM 18170]|uniref:Heat shock protein 70 n=1 Tax=Phocaeicola salanitronis (strain DSM 18170 / JCM 13657 / CCUG 60908 / BL78) TaxID=667015 RepID=F0R0Q7_PHOSB|nr:Hsp70 family protein [Phocaeicola salanitronis]ADY36261.1 Heat shock protein 70 [Phocaeicola salanitronis DSM 18170]